MATARIRPAVGRLPDGVVVAAGGYTLAGSAVPLAAGGPGIGRLAAQRLARSELSKDIYQPSLTQRFLNWLSRLLLQVNANVPGGWWALIALSVAAVLVIATVIFWIRPVRSRRGADRALLQGRALSARDHRHNAERCAAAGDYCAAIIECVRAIAVELEERGILPPKPARTADELAAETGRTLPAHGRELAVAARLFDDVRYGGRTGTAAGYQRVRELDTSLQSAKPAGAAPAQHAAAARPVP